MRNKKLNKELKKRIFAGLLVGAILFGSVSGTVTTFASETTGSEAVATEEAGSTQTPASSESDPAAVPDDVSPVEILLHIDVAPKVKNGTVYLKSKDSGTEYTAAIVKGQAGIPLMPGTYTVTRIEDEKGQPVQDITENTIVAEHKVFATTQYSITNAKAQDPMYQFVSSQADFLLNHVVSFIIVIVLAGALYKIQKDKETVGKKE